jgi:hypothetical protein
MKDQFMMASVPDEGHHELILHQVHSPSLTDPSSGTLAIMN